MAVMLKRNAAPLLRIVHGKEHATDQDHEADSSKLGRGTTEPDTDRDPDSSDDDDDRTTSWKPPITAKSVRVPARSSISANIHGSRKSSTVIKKDAAAAKSSGFKRPTALEDEQKDKEDRWSDEAERNVFSASQEQRKRPKVGYSGSQKKKFGKKDKPASQPEPRFRKPKGHTPVKPKSEKVAQFRKPRGLDNEGDSLPSSSQADVPSSSGPTFRIPRGVGDTSGLESVEASAISRADESPPSRSSRSPSLSSLSSLDSVEVQELDLPEPSKRVAKSRCPLCKTLVEDSFRQDFEVEHCRGGRMNFRMQERFCKAHKARTARQVWEDRGYPEIEWTSFHKRMTSHHDRLHAVLDGEADSYYREQLEERLRSNTSKTTMKGINLDAHPGSGVGYYGSRGEKRMIDHIMRSFSDKIRRVAASNRLMATMGVSGGVSGYVQAVLVPEMAQALVMEDTGLGAEEARRIIAESSDVGEAVNEEEEEKVPGRVIDTSDAEEVEGED
ncbi:hypothetical protein MBLNU459_g4678t1 [Dothideomycetes sp. NU459]